jgi:SNF family Na+-dependent transporter
VNSSKNNKYTDFGSQVYAGRPDPKKEHFITLKNRKNRPYWHSQREFLMALLTMAFGWTNILVFPSFVYKYGMGDFLVAYFVVAAIIGWPVFFMELAIGQFCGVGLPLIWDVVPAFKGLGTIQTVVAFLHFMYINFLNAVTLFYLGESFRNEIQWTKCSAPWVSAADNCFFSEAPLDQNTSAIARFAPEIFLE